jgi:hypothetical protein
MINRGWEVSCDGDFIADHSGLVLTVQLCWRPFTHQDCHLGRFWRQPHFSPLK